MWTCKNLYLLVGLLTIFAYQDRHTNENTKKITCSRLHQIRNAKVMCKRDVCNVNCMMGYQLPTGLKKLDLSCINGKWIDKYGQFKETNCRPMCTPPCKNGGTCRLYNRCKCPKNFGGPQCQYDIEQCEPEKVFNGGYNCVHSNTEVICKMTCPDDTEFEDQPSDSYTCVYAKGYFEPERIPQCKDAILDVHGTLESKDGVYHKKKKSKSGIYPLKTTKGITAEDQQTPTPQLCSTSNGRHVKTFEDIFYNAPLYCGHTLVKGNDDEFVVAVHSCPYGSEPGCPHNLHVTLESNDYWFRSQDYTRNMSVASKKLPVLIHIADIISVTYFAQFLKIELESIGLVIYWDLKQGVTIEANAELWNRTSGLCNLDRNDRNDFVTKNGSILTTSKTFVDSWIIDNKNDSLICEIDDDGEITGTNSPREIEEEATKICKELIGAAKLQHCLKEFDKNLLLEACVAAYCSCPNTENRITCGCDVITTLNTKCQFQGIILDNDWRNMSMCPMECNKDRVYLSCGPTEEPTCDSMIDPRISGACKEGCFCPDGKVQHNGNCVSMQQCPCTIRNKKFEAGSKIKKDCNTCICENRDWKCTKESCDGVTSAGGDPHYKTFDGKRYDFMGNSTYYFMVTNNLTIETEHTACFTYATCIKSVTIRFEVDEKEISIKLAYRSVTYVDDKEVKKYPKMIGNGIVVLRQASSTIVSVDFSDGLRISWDGWNGLSVVVPFSYTNRTKGLCGTFNANQDDDFMNPAGEIETVIEQFGDKWRKNISTGYTGDTPSMPHPCTVGDDTKAKAENYCARLKSETFESCHWAVDPVPFYDNCVYDMCACKVDATTCLCPMLALYGTACSRQGITTNWRNGTKECAPQCAIGQIYDECGDSCMRTCADMKTSVACLGSCVEGCRCPAGQYLDDKNQCIPKNQCPCIFEGTSFPIGYKEVQHRETIIELCTCMPGSWECEAANDTDKDLYPSSSEMKIQCANETFTEFLDCLPVEPKSCKNMHKYREDIEDCKPGCGCLEDYVRDTSANECVLPQNCPCYHGGRSYNEGEEIHVECWNYTCESGVWAYTSVKCASTCSVWGNSHFSTFDRKDFDFQGVCNYLLSKGKQLEGDGFSITIQNGLCGSMGVTCFKSVKVELIGTVTDALTLYSDQLDKNSEELRRIASNEWSNGLTAYNAGLFTIIEVTDLGLQIKWDHGKRLYVRLDDQWQGNVVGLCGNYNGDSEDDLKIPSEDLEISSLQFGHYWKLQEFCALPTEQIESCTVHPDRENWANKKCGILKSELFQPCHSEFAFEKYYKRCIFDVCACDWGGDNECLCTAIAAYAQECALKRISIAWRSRDLCPIQCDPYSAGYNPCVHACPLETCDSFGLKQRMCHSEICMEGCSIAPCQEGYMYLNESYAECVPIQKCRPICLEKNGIVYYEGDTVDSDECQICRCSNKTEICNDEPCTSVAEASYSTTEKSISSENEIKCTEGWRDWVNLDTVNTASKTYDFELNSRYLPHLLVHELLSCLEENVIVTECRLADPYGSSDGTSDSFSCTLEGLPCIGVCHNYEIRVYCGCGRI